jgi:uncharacterized protein YegJ (DUF2314 family)
VILKRLTALCPAFALAFWPALVALPETARAQEALSQFTHDPDMSRAVSQARAQLDVVFSQLTDGAGGLHPALNLKASLPVNQHGVEAEVIWVEGLTLEDGVFTGTLANSPAYMPGYQLGDHVRFTRSQIADWSVLEADGRMYGHYTTRVLIDRLPREEADQIRDLISPQPMPEAWR